jgi:deoxyribodipyrimidine photo-lyase
MTLDRLASDPRITVRSRGMPDPDGEAIVYWMQRAQRAMDNPALDFAVSLGNLLRKPVVVFFGVNPFVERANLRHYAFLADGVPGIAEGLQSRRVGFVLRTSPSHRLLPFLNDVRPVALVGDENPLRQMAAWRDVIAEQVRVPFWTVDADVVVPGALIEGEQYAARTIRPRLHRHLHAHLEPAPEPVAEVAWGRGATLSTVTPATLLERLPVDRAVAPVAGLRGGLREARRRLEMFIATRLATYPEARNLPEEDATSHLSPYLHFGHIGPRDRPAGVRAALRA